MGDFVESEAKNKKIASSVEVLLQEEIQLPGQQYINKLESHDESGASFETAISSSWGHLKKLESGGYEFVKKITTSTEINIFNHVNTGKWHLVFPLEQPVEIYDTNFELKHKTKSMFKCDMSIENVTNIDRSVLQCGYDVYFINTWSHLVCIDTASSNFTETVFDEVEIEDLLILNNNMLLLLQPSGLLHLYDASTRSKSLLIKATQPSLDLATIEQTLAGEYSKESPTEEKAPSKVVFPTMLLAEKKRRLLVSYKRIGKQTNHLMMINSQTMSYISHSFTSATGTHYDAYFQLKLMMDKFVICNRNILAVDIYLIGKKKIHVVRTISLDEEIQATHGVFLNSVLVENDRFYTAMDYLIQPIKLIRY